MGAHQCFAPTTQATQIAQQTQKKPFGGLPSLKWAITTITGTMNATLQTVSRSNDNFCFQSIPNM